jgi:endo-1,4-beta-xylanase
LHGSSRYSEHSGFNNDTEKIVKKIYLQSLLFLIFLNITFSVQAQMTLKDTFKDDFLIGAALNRSQFSGQDKRALPIIKTQFNTISPENALKWESVHPGLQKYNFAEADKYVRFGERNNMFIVGHTLVWHNQTPPEVFEDKDGNPVTRNVLLGRMREHIEKVVGRYKGRIDAWDVVNEALNEDGTLRQSPWLKIIGEDYIVRAFEFAHQADPSAELYYNDYSIENEPKRKGAIRLIKTLLEKKIPVKAIGLQGHNNFKFPTLQQQEETIRAFSKLGIKVIISELDVSVLPDPEGFSGAEVTLDFEMHEKLNPYQSGLPKAIEEKLADRYVSLFEVYRKHREDILRVTFWNVTDGDSWLNNFPVRGRTNYPLLFDRRGKTKRAFDKILSNFGKNMEN